MNEAANVTEGMVIEGRYRVVSRIADGGMATVYQAVDERLERTVAIKVMHTQLAQGPHREQFVERFHREAKSAAAIANPHIVQVYDTGEFNGLDYLVMEYVHGVNLRHEMNQQGTFTVRETVRVLMETLDGLAAAHRAGVVHRDIKPENILLNDRGRVQITDFGLAKAASQATLSSTGMLLGTAAYLAPEMIERNEATPQGDLYSIGIMAWEMLAGQVPFVSDNPVTLVFKHVHEDVPSVETVCPGVHPAIAGFLAHLTARQVQDRPVDVGVALAELRAACEGLSLDDWHYRKAPDGPVVGAAGVLAGTDATTPGQGALPPMPPARATEAVQATSVPAPLPTTPIDAQQSAQPTQTLPSTQAIPATQAIPSTQSLPATQTIPSTQTLPVAEADATQPLTAASPAVNVEQAAMTEPILAGDISTGPIDADGSNVPSPKKSRSRKPLIITLVVLLVLAACGGTGAWWWYLGPGSYWSLPQPTDVTCAEDETCSLSGAEWSAYESTLKVAGIPYQTTQDFSDDVAEGDIIDVSVAGAKASVGTHISKRQNQRLDVTISKGVRMATIPEDILDANSAAGKDPLGALKAAGFDNVHHDESADQWSETLPAGAAIAVTPKPGSELKHNDEVTVTLSKGPMPVNMPDIEGRSKDEAQQALSDLKLKANFSEEFSDTVPAGEVLSASVPKDTQLKWGDSVDVVVSKGPQMVTVPDVRGQDYDAAAKTLKALGLNVRKSAPLGDITHVVRLQDPSPGQQVRVRSANGTPTTVTLTVV